MYLKIKDKCLDMRLEIELMYILFPLIILDVSTT
jgi:hypothetical protein